MDGRAEFSRPGAPTTAVTSSGPAPERRDPGRTRAASPHRTVLPFFMPWHGRLRAAPGSAGPPGAQSGHQVGILGLDDPVPVMLEVDYPGDHVEFVVELIGGAVVRSGRYPVLLDPADGVLDGDPGAGDLGVVVQVPLGQPAGIRVGSGVALYSEPRLGPGVVLLDALVAPVVDVDWTLLLGRLRIGRRL